MAFLFYRQDFKILVLIQFLLLSRYLAICHPFLVQQDAIEVSFRGKRTRSRRVIGHFPPSRKRLYKYTIIVLIGAVASNISTFWEFTTYLDHETNQRKIKVASLRLDENYVTYFKTGFEGIVLVVVPFVVMVCLNARIIYTLRQRGKIRNIIANINSQMRAKNEMNLATILVTMDLVFLVCNLGKVIVNIWEIYHIGELTDCMRLEVPYKVNLIPFLRIVTNLYYCLKVIHNIYNHKFIRNNF